MQMLRFRAFPTRRAAMRLAAALALASALALAAACGGGDGDDGEDADAEATATATGTPAPTATPFARVPEPTIVSGPPPTPTPTAASEQAYVVEPGDSLSAIAGRFGSTIDAIMERNDIADPNQIYVGQTLVIPAAGGATDDSGAADDAGAADGAEGEDGSAAADGGADGGEASDEGPTSHEVAPGETAYAIALQYGVTLDELAAANGTTVEELNSIQAGQTLVIP